MKNKKTVIKSVAAVLIVAFFLMGALVINSLNSRFLMEERSFVAMDTVVTEKIYDSENALKHISPVKNLVQGLEDVLSRYKEDSSVSRINSGERITDIAVSSIVDKLKKISGETDGAFDITVGKLVDLWGIGTDTQRVPDEKEIRKVLEDIDYKKVISDTGAVSLEGKGEMDLGAVGKGYACDVIKVYLESTQVEGAIISVGGSILAYGDYNKLGSDWKIAIRHPRNENEFLGVVSLDEGFVSTSGDYERYFEKDGVRYHHIFDANTGYPADSGLISVTVVAESGVLSDALSTACFILGEEKGRELIEKYNASAIFVDEELNITRVGEINFEEE